ncbi:MAG: LapA family protein [Planctomycetota bacterium]
MSLRNKKNIALVVLLVLGVVLMFQNTAEVHTQFFFWSLTMPRALLLATSFVFGLAAGYLWSSLRQRRNGRSDDPRL